MTDQPTPELNAALCLSRGLGDVYKRQGVAEGVAGMVAALVGELEQHRGVVVAEATG